MTLFLDGKAHLVALLLDVRFLEYLLLLGFRKRWGRDDDDCGGLQDVRNLFLFHVDLFVGIGQRPQFPLPPVFRAIFYLDRNLGALFNNGDLPKRGGKKSPLCKSPFASSSSSKPRNAAGKIRGKGQKTDHELNREHHANFPRYM